MKTQMISGALVLYLLMLTVCVAGTGGCKREKLYGYRPPNYFPVTRDDIHSVVALDSQKIWATGSFAGIYHSPDGGATWQHMGLENSEHIAMILIDPRDSNTVYVAAEGPLWSPGGDRGLFKSVDGGASWEKILGGGPYTGVASAVMHTTDPDILYAATWQHHRTVAALIDGVPAARASISEKIWHAGLAREYLLRRHNAATFRIEISTAGMGHDEFRRAGRQMITNLAGMTEWDPALG